MPACLHCGLDGRHFDGCPEAKDGPVVTRNDDPPICSGWRLNDTLDRYVQQLAERSREW